MKKGLKWLKGSSRALGRLPGSRATPNLRAGPAWIDTPGLDVLHPPGRYPVASELLLQLLLFYSVQAWQFDPRTRPRSPKAQSPRLYITQRLSSHPPRSLLPRPCGRCRSHLRALAPEARSGGGLRDRVQVPLMMATSFMKPRTLKHIDSREQKQ